MDNNTANVNLEHLRDLARRAYYFTSFDPDKRADQIVKEYGEELHNDLKEIREKSTGLVEQEALNDSLSRYRQKYEKLLADWLHSHSRLASSAVVGPAKFPVARMEKYRAWEENKYKNFRDWRDRALKAICRVPKQEISELEEAKQKLEHREKIQAIMVSANKIIRKGGPDVADKLKELGLPELSIQKFLSHNGANKTAFRSYRLANNNAEIRRLRSRVTMLEAKADLAKNKGEKIEEVNGVKLIHNYQEDKVQIKFEKKPQQEILSQLNSRKFHWIRSKEIWQRKLTNNAIADAQNIVKGIKR